ncbi:multidrug ABC transporter ATP-binding protein [Mangrovihabitans endophyticus]|uniref:Multidrug ABC transporter ATP-binding protein n=1 Tax=Mangrovihabitans endophyticus TaxID=1751298 RepID=A0A8J3BSE5_9ACTN|nr:multidrug ABC transporter ATP-binding protein [Mangrovihabitans endophyticus]
MAVDDLTVDIAPGRVTGFLGPNGAGKSTTMRMIMGLDHPTAGTATIGGLEYHRFRHPLREVGALLDAKALHPGRSARNHLLAMARSNGIPARRVDEVLGIVGLSEVARQRAGAYSLGMGQRLGIAGALLGDPGTLIFDEPVNGLDPDGVRWVRGLARSLAGEGRTVFVSSHLMSEMQLTADHLVVIGRGRLITDAPIVEVLSGSSPATVRIRVPDTDERSDLAGRLRVAGFPAEPVPPDGLLVRGATLSQVGDLAHAAGARLHELASADPSLEEAYMRLTGDSVEYRVPTQRHPAPEEAG